MTLERLGWKFARVRGGEFFRDPDKALQPLWTRLTELAINPQCSEAAEPQGSFVEEIRLLTKKYLEKIRNDVVVTAASDFDQPSQSDGGQDDRSVTEARREQAESSPATQLQSDDALRLALLRLRDGVIMRAQPSVPRERGLLRMRMVQALLRYLPTSVEEFNRRIPKALRDETDPAQLEYLPEVIRVIAEHVSDGRKNGRSTLFE